jgi:hypothetical protein
MQQPPPPSSSTDFSDTNIALPGQRRLLQRWLYGVAIASLLGAIFAAFSTSDFIKHLDRQVHSIHCSFIPGAGQTFAESGCKAAMMSPFSSMLRTSLWGGLPISLLGLAVFAYLLFRALHFSQYQEPTRRELSFLVAATALPVATSFIYAAIAIIEVGNFKPARQWSNLWPLVCRGCAVCGCAQFGLYGPCALQSQEQHWLWHPR